MFSLKESRMSGILALVALAFVFATAGVFARYLGDTFMLFEQMYLRIGGAFLIACIILAPTLRLRQFLTLSLRDHCILVFRALALYGGVTLFVLAVLTTTLANASFTAALPLLPIFGYIFFREKLKLKTLGWIGVGVIGIGLISLIDLQSFRFGLGELYALGCVILFDLSYVARRWHSDHLSNMESATYMFFVGAIALFITSMLAGEPLPSASDFTPWVMFFVAGAAIFNVANLYLTNYGFKNVKIAVAGNILTLETIFALLYSVLLFHEDISIREMFGGLLVILSVVMVNASEAVVDDTVSQNSESK
jgi:drug/metabolite transporter (DMT)-like permease